MVKTRPYRDPVAKCLSMGIYLIKVIDPSAVKPKIDSGEAPG